MNFNLHSSSFFVLFSQRIQLRISRSFSWSVTTKYLLTFSVFRILYTYISNLIHDILNFVHRNYVSLDDLIFNGLMEMLGMDKRAIPIDIEAGDDEKLRDYQEPDDISEKSDDHEVEEIKREVKIESQPLFGFTYKPGQNLPEEMSYNENFIAKLSSKVDLGTFVLGEDEYPTIFDIAIEAVEEEKQRKTQGSVFIKISSACSKKVSDNDFSQIFFSPFFLRYLNSSHLNYCII